MVQSKYGIPCMTVDVLIEDEDTVQVTIAEVEELVEPGEIPPDAVHTPGIFVHRVIRGERYEKPIEQRTVRKRS